MIVREPAELAYLRDQQQREEQADQRAEDWDFDCAALEGLVRTWGIEAIAKKLKEIHGQLDATSDFRYSVTSSTAFAFGYDDNEHIYNHRDEF